MEGKVEIEKGEEKKERREKRERKTKCYKYRRSNIKGKMDRKREKNYFQRDFRENDKGRRGVMEGKREERIKRGEDATEEEEGKGRKEGQG